jgi:hypothetical protein
MDLAVNGIDLHFGFRTGDSWSNANDCGLFLVEDPLCSAPILGPSLRVCDTRLDPAETELLPEGPSQFRNSRLHFERQLRQCTTVRRSMLSSPGFG